MKSESCPREALTYPEGGDIAVGLTRQVHEHCHQLVTVAARVIRPGAVQLRIPVPLPVPHALPRRVRLHNFRVHTRV